MLKFFLPIVSLVCRTSFLFSLRNLEGSSGPVESPLAVLAPGLAIWCQRSVTAMAVLPLDGELYIIARLLYL